MEAAAKARSQPSSKAVAPDWLVDPDTAAPAAPVTTAPVAVAAAAATAVPATTTAAPVTAASPKEESKEPGTAGNFASARAFQARNASHVPMW